MKNFLILSLVFFGYSLSVFGQDGRLILLNPKSKKKILDHWEMEMIVKKNRLYTNLNSLMEGNKILLETNSGKGFISTYLYIDSNEKQQVSNAKILPLSSNSDSIYQSELIEAKKIFSNFSFYSGEMEGKVKFHFIRNKKKSAQLKVY